MRTIAETFTPIFIKDRTALGCGCCGVHLVRLLNGGPEFFLPDGYIEEETKLWVPGPLMEKGDRLVQLFNSKN